MAERTVGGYEIERELGRGGMAVVYLARQQGLDRKVALKELLGLHAPDSSSAQRFLQESRLAGSLNHPNIVTVFDYFLHGGVPYISMELVERGPLTHYVGRLTDAQTYGVLEGMLAGLAVAHARGIVHRDLKPANVMVSWDGRVKIADFGIAKAFDQAYTGGLQTGTGHVIGTPTYMAPEQAMSGEIGPWSDLYSLGVIAYELLVGRLPFAGKAAAIQLLMAHAAEPVPPPRSLRPELDQGIADWIDRLLAKAPADRFQSARAAWEVLDARVGALLGPHWRRDSPLPALDAGTAAALAVAPPSPPITPAAPPTPPPPTPRTEIPAAPQRRPRRIAIAPLALAVGAVVGIVLAAVVLLPGDDDPPQRQVEVAEPAARTDAAEAADAQLAFQRQVGRVCAGIDRDRLALPRRQRTLVRKLRSARTVRQQRDALLAEYKHQLSVSNQLLPRLEALTPPDATARHTRLAALNAWRRNVLRAERRRDALNTVATMADLRRAARVPDRGAIEDDSERLSRRLLQLAPEQCELSVAPPAPVITLPALPDDVAPGGSRPAGPGATEPAPSQPDVSPAQPSHPGPSEPDVAPPAPDVAPPSAAGGSEDVSPPVVGEEGPE